MIQRHLFRLSSAIVLSGLLTCAQAVELGDVLVRSHIGQPLSADFELTGIANEAASVQVALADADVYRGANISIHPALSALNITIVRRDGKRYLHIASPKAVESDYVHIFFELTENGRRSVREATLWFTPDPNPAPPPAKVAPAVVAPAPAPAKAPAVAAESPRAVAAPVLAPLLRTAQAARPAACVQQFTAAQIGTCAALDAKNAALTAQIVELEDKVRLLTVAMHGQVAPAAAARPSAHAPAPMKLAQAPAKKPAGATPWLFIGIASAAVFALIGVLVYFMRRKRKAAKAAKKVVKVSPGFMASVRNRLLPSKKEPEPPVQVEPTVE
jgi:hypothetical protein